MFNPLKSKIAWTLAACLMIVTVSGCANELALLRPGSTQTFAVQSVDYNAAFSHAVQAAKELHYTIGLEDKDKGRLTMNRGYGYGESSYIWIEVKHESPGKVSITLDVKSSGGSEPIIHEFMETYNKYVKTA